MRISDWSSDVALPIFDPKIVPVQNSAHEVGLGECAIFDAWVKAANAAGPGLTRASLIAGAEQSGTFGIAGTYDGSFGPGKPDAVDLERESGRRTCRERVCQYV